MKEYSTYLFDIDGTLLDTMELIYQTFHYTCLKYTGKEPTREMIWSTVGIPLAVQMDLYLGDTGDRKEEILNSHMARQAVIYKDYLKIFPDVRETLSALYNKGKTLGIVTSRTTPSLLCYLRHFDIEQYFSIIITPDCSGKHKPDPEPVFKALEQSSALPEETVFLGDAEVDILSGSRASVDTAFASWGPNRLEDLTVQPTWDLKSIKEFIS